MSIRATAKEKLHYTVSLPLTCLQTRRKQRRWTQHKTQKFKCSRLVLLFCLTTLLTLFFFFTKDNAEVITALSGTSTKHGIITKVLSSVKVHAVRRGANNTSGSSVERLVNVAAASLSSHNNKRRRACRTHHSFSSTKECSGRCSDAGSPPALLKRGRNLSYAQTLVRRLIILSCENKNSWWFHWSC